MTIFGVDLRDPSATLLASRQFGPAFDIRLRELAAYATQMTELFHFAVQADTIKRSAVTTAPAVSAISGNSPVVKEGSPPQVPVPQEATISEADDLRPAYHDTNGLPQSNLSDTCLTSASNLSIRTWPPSYLSSPEPNNPDNSHHISS